MGKIKWVGDPNAENKEETPEHIEAFGLTFKDGEAETDNEVLLKKASANPFFEVEGYDAKHPSDRDKALHIPPSQQSAQGPVPKAGEPVVPELPVPELTPPPEVENELPSEGTPEGTRFKPIPRV